MKHSENNALPRVSIISVNYNEIDVTLEMLESLQKISYPDYEVIIVDNGSPDDDPRRITRRHPWVRLITSEKNLGFAGGNNLAVPQATGKYLLFLNNDTEVDEGFLEPMVEHFEWNPDAGMASPKIIFHHGESKNRLQYAGARAINPYTVRGKSIGFMDVDNGQHDVVRETDRCHGAAMMVPVTVMEKVGLMADMFFLYYEEHDWCERIKRAGFRIYFIGTSAIYHKESMSVGKQSVLKTYYMNRGRLIYARRNISGVQRIIFFLFFVLFALPKNVAAYFLRGEMKHLKAFWAACTWNLGGRDVMKTPGIRTDGRGNKTLVNTTEQTVRRFS